MVDVFPTVLDMFRLKTKKNIDGTSLLPFVYEEKIKELPAYSETFYPEELAKKDKTFKNISSKKSLRISNKYKIIFNVKDSKLEVYDLEKDKDEKRPFVSCYNIYLSFSSIISSIWFMDSLISFLSSFTFYLMVYPSKEIYI